jgi:D-alanyl-D-alanine dipeptidase
MQVALQRLIDAAYAVGGSPSVGSAYRPPAYNQHLIDVWNKYKEFLDAADRPEVTTNASCMLVLWPKIKQHFQKHKLLVTQPPVLNSRHTRGLAVDVTIDLPSANIDALATNCCGLHRPIPIEDPVHFQFP